MLFSTLQSNLKAWCERHGCQTIQFPSNRLDFVTSQSPVAGGEDCGGSHDGKVVSKPSFVFVDSTTTASVLDSQLDLAAKIHLNCHSEDRLFFERFECRIYTYEANFRRRKVFARNFLHKSKFWEAHALETADRKQAGPNAIEPISVATLTSQSVHSDIEKQDAHQIRIQWDPQLDSQPRHAFNLPEVTNQPIPSSSVRRLTASINDQIVGSLSLNLDTTDASESNVDAKQSPAQRPIYEGCTAAGIYNFYVQPDFRQQGVGTELIQAAVEYCAGHGVAQVGLFCDPERSGFYQRLGFKSLGILEEWKSASLY